MKVRYKPLLAVLVLGIAGCASQVPTVEPWAPASTYKLQVAQQWDDVARQVAERLAAGLRTMRHDNQPLVFYVEKPPCQSGFNCVFHQLLTTQLLAQGFGVTTDPNAGLPLKYFTQSVPHSTYQPPYTEVVINVSVMSGDRYLSRISDIYYVADYDVPYFVVQATTPLRRMEVVGP